MAVRQIPVQYARRTSGRSNEKNLFGSRQYIPLKLNASGVMPIIFAQALMFAPAYVGGALETSPLGSGYKQIFLIFLDYGIIYYLLY